MSKRKNSFSQISRRDFLKYSLAAGAVTPLALSMGRANALETNARIIIVGAGAAGTSMANRLSRKLTNASITIVDAREEHYYQPGWTLVASGLWDEQDVITTTKQWLPKGINWVKGMVAEYNPDSNELTLTNGDTLQYDYLIVASGLQLHYDRLDGMDANLIGQGHGIGSVYASPSAAAGTSQEIERWIAKGTGRGLFNLPTTPIKCAGAPLKMTFTTLDRLEKTGQRDQYDVEFMTPTGRLFSVDYYNDFVAKRFADQGVVQQNQWTLTGLDHSAKKAYYDVDGEQRTKEYEFIHVVPPMTGGEAVANSALAFQPGETFAGCLRVDRETLQNPDYPNVFGIGDVMGMPINKTAASVKLQAAVLEHNFLAHLKGEELTAKHNGYTSCPLITAVGKAMLVEFGWDGKLLPSFPFIDPKKESWAVWVMKEEMLQPAYYAMLHGRA